MPLMTSKPSNPSNSIKYIYIVGIVVILIIGIIILSRINSSIQENFSNSIQYFKVFTKNGLFLDVNPKLEIVATKESQEPSQYWSYSDQGVLTNKFNNMCLTVYQNLKVDGAKLYLENFTNQQGQMWEIDDQGHIKCHLNNGLLTVNSKNSVYIHVGKPKSSSVQQIWLFKFLNGDSGNSTSSFTNLLSRIKIVDCFLVLTNLWSVVC